MPADLARFVRTYPGAVDDTLAADLIALPGAELLDLGHRRCSLTPVVGDVLDRFRGAVRECFADYCTISATLDFCTLLEGPNVLRYQPSTPDHPEWFHEHADAWNVASATRQVSVIAYLNDVVQGGETVFPALDYSQRCEKGSVVLFPSNYLYHHIARPPESGPKIVVVTWIHFGNDGQPVYLTTPLGDLSAHKLARDRRLLLAEVERDPEDFRPVFNLAQRYFDSGDFVNARKWYARRAEMDGPDEEVFFAMHRLAESMHKVGEPWPDVKAAYLRAWEFRPTRAEPLFAIAFNYRIEQQYRCGYEFARRAAEIPLPVDDLMVRADVYAWRAADEQAVCAARIGKHAEAFTLWRRVLARPDIPDHDRARIAANRDICVPAMIEAASSYPDELVQRLTAGPREGDVTVSLVAGPDNAATEQTLNSFLHCCTDLSRVGRFLIVYVGMSALDRAMLRERAMLRKRFGFLEFVDYGPEEGSRGELAQLRAQIGGRFWLHLGQGWQVFAPENLITRLTAVLDAEPQVFQVGINFADAAKLTGANAAEQAVRRTPEAGRYVLTDEVASGPAMFDTARLDQAGGLDSTEPDPITELGRRAAAAGLQTASLDEVLCVTAI